MARGVGGHGLVGVMRNGIGPTVMLRTDMDALPVAERYRAAEAWGEPLASLHSPEFAPLPGPTIDAGVEAMTAAAPELLGAP